MLPSMNFINRRDIELNWNISNGINVLSIVCLTFVGCFLAINIGDNFAHSRQLYSMASPQCELSYMLLIHLEQLLTNSKNNKTNVEHSEL